MQVDTSVPPPLPPRSRDAHKGSFGRVLVLGGSEGMAGAVVLATRAALRGGAGLVTAGCPRSIYPAIAAQLTNAMTWPLPDSPGGLLARGALAPLLAAFDDGRFGILAVGPGLGRDPATGELARQLIQQLPHPWVADADALTAIARRPGLLGACAHAGVLTPHPGEMARVIGSTAADVQADRAGAARAFCRRYPDHVLVLKGAGTLVASHDALWRCDAGNPGMATGGTGDVLTGLVAALLAQGLTTFEASRLAVWLHARAGDLAAGALGESSLVATDLIQHLPQAFRELRDAP
jgi:NAD(P)H-hydrate epimerase